MKATACSSLLCPQSDKAIVPLYLGLDLAVIFWLLSTEVGFQQQCLRRHDPRVSRMLFPLPCCAGPPSHFRTTVSAQAGAVHTGGCSSQLTRSSVSSSPTVRVGVIRVLPGHLLLAGPTPLSTRPLPSSRLLSCSVLNHSRTSVHSQSPPLPVLFSFLPLVLPTDLRELASHTPCSGPAPSLPHPVGCSSEFSGWMRRAVAQGSKSSLRVS